MGDGTSSSDGTYNISMHQSFRWNDTDYYTVFDLPISVSNSISESSDRVDCALLENKMINIESSDTLPGQPWLTSGVSASSTQSGATATQTSGGVASSQKSGTRGSRNVCYVFTDGVALVGSPLALTFSLTPIFGISFSFYFLKFGDWSTTCEISLYILADLR